MQSKHKNTKPNNPSITDNVIVALKKKKNIPVDVFSFRTSPIVGPKSRVTLHKIVLFFIF